VHRPGILVILATTTVLCIARPARVSAQDAHYWNLQYGTRAELLGGAVIGSKVGLSNTYYNPGALGLLARPSLVLSSLALEVTSVSLPQQPPMKDIGDLRLSAVPSFVAGTLWFSVLGGNRLAYSFLTRQDFELRLKQRAEITVPGVGGAPDTIRAGEILGEAHVGENWLGVTWSRSIKPGLGIGWTQYIAYRGQRTRNQLVGQESVSGGPGRGVHLIDEFDFWHVRTLSKLGVLYEGERYSVGLTATTPSLGILGSGTVFTSIYDPVIAVAPLAAANFQQDLSPDYKSEWAVGGGLSYRYRSTRLHASLEWYQAISRREVLPTQHFRETSTGTWLSNSVFQELNAVTNFGLGVEHTLNSRVQLYVSYITNFSALPENNDTNMGVASWDIYQLTAGSNFTLKGIEFTLGLEYGFGSNTVDRLKFTDEDSTTETTFAPDPQEVKFRRLEGFLGFTFLFGEDPNEKPRQTLGQGDGA